MVLFTSMEFPYGLIDQLFPMAHCALSTSQMVLVTNVNLFYQTKHSNLGSVSPDRYHTNMFMLKQFIISCWNDVSTHIFSNLFLHEVFQKYLFLMAQNKEMKSNLLFVLSQCMVRINEVLQWRKKFTFIIGETTQGLVWVFESTTF